jgi:hypothetical protein
MILLLEIWLTIRAWKNGWGARALIPGGLAFLAGVFLGALQMATGTRVSVGLGAIVVDLVAVVALAVMASRKSEAASIHGHIDQVNT